MTELIIFWVNNNWLLVHYAKSILICFLCATHQMIDLSNSRECLIIIKTLMTKGTRLQAEAKPS